MVVAILEPAARDDVDGDPRSCSSARYRSVKSNGTGALELHPDDEGESFVVTRNGVPVGELTPLRRLRFVSAESVTEIFRSAPAFDAQQFRRDLDELANQEITPRG